jgi:hypothetical protein
MKNAAEDIKKKNSITGIEYGLPKNRSNLNPLTKAKIMV